MSKMRLSDPNEYEHAMELATQLRSRHIDINKENLLIKTIEAKSELLREIRAFFHSEDIIEHSVPHIVAKTGACESHDRIFSIDYYGHEAFLVQACQLHQECFLPHFREVFSINESFRREHYFDTNNHLAESTLVESLCLGRALDEELEFLERMLHCIATNLLSRCSRLFDYFGTDNLELIQKPFKRVSFSEALKAAGINKTEFSPIDERKIFAALGRAIYIMYPPEEIKFFTTRRRGEIAIAADLYLDGCGEVAGITETEEDPQKLLMQFLRSPLAPARSQYDWSFELHKEFNFFQSGFGLGLERLLKFICGLPHISLAVPFPRAFAHFNP